VTRRVIRAMTLAFAFGGVWSASLSAQYFGSNKVQYDRFDFQVLPTSHFDIYYYADEAEATKVAARLAERWYGRLSHVLGHTLTERPPIVLYASHAHFTQTTILPGNIPEGVGGFTDHQRGRVVLPFTATLGETDHVLGHELVHAFQRDILRDQGAAMGLLPLWFTEGMAEYLSVGRVDTNTAMWLRDAVRRDRLPTLKQLDDPRWFPYRYGQALWAFLSERFGDDLAARALASKAKGGAIGRLVATTGVDSATLTRDWHAALRSTYGTPTAESGGEDPHPVLVAGRKGDVGRYNVGPALSPDGRYVVFLSERDGYSIDVFLAETETGRIVRKLVSTAADPHYDSLQFLESAGAWDAQGKRFAMATVRRGQAVLAVLQMPAGTIQMERAFADLDQIYSPTWSPDGTRIVFSALRGGSTDLYEFDVVRRELRRLTHDAYADLEPAWSPDGRTIAFVTDRFTSSMTTLTFGDFRLAALDLETGDVRPLPSISDAKNINPQWSGGDLYFIADPNGVSNVFRAVIATGEVRQITRVESGVSGVTSLSPALSLAQGRVAFSEYRNGVYEIRSTPTCTCEENRVVVTGTRPALGAWLTDDAPDEAPAAKARPYDRRLSLTGIGQPYLSAGGGSYGGFFRAGTSFSISDLLEERQINTAVQVGLGGSRRDFAVQSVYLNRQTRWNWGIAGTQIPVLLGVARAPASTESPSAPTVTREVDLLSQTHRQIAGVTVYPFSRAKRVEFSGGFHSITSDRQVATRVYARGSGALLTESQEPAAAVATAKLFDASAALVYDTSLMGATGPVLGTRYRFEAAPTFGDLSYATLLADYRRYMMPVAPITLAVRFQDVGRYGADAGDSRLLPLVWTIRDLVRGYDAQDVLTTRRLTVANLEARIPLMGPVGLLSRVSALPLDAIVFGDAAAFWNGGTANAGAPRILRSAGVGVRFNAAGFVFEIDGAHTFDTAPRGWRLSFNFMPGF
jgi:Tol biopolymer transport system component